MSCIKECILKWYDYNNPHLCFLFIDEQDIENINTNLWLCLLQMNLLKRLQEFRTLLDIWAQYISVYTHPEKVDIIKYICFSVKRFSCNFICNQILQVVSSETSGNGFCFRTKRLNCAEAKVKKRPKGRWKEEQSDGDIYSDVCDNDLLDNVEMSRRQWDGRWSEDSELKLRGNYCRVQFPRHTNTGPKTKADRSNATMVVAALECSMEENSRLQLFSNFQAFDPWNPRRVSFSFLFFLKIMFQCLLMSSLFPNVLYGSSCFTVFWFVLCLSSSLHWWCFRRRCQSMWRRRRR